MSDQPTPISDLDDFLADEEMLAVARDQGRDLMADSIDGYMSEGGEFRSYDLADRLTKKLNLAGWWFVHGGDVERMISQEHPFNVKMKERADAAEAECERLRAVVEAAKEVGDSDFRKLLELLGREGHDEAALRVLNFRKALAKLDNLEGER